MEFAKRMERFETGIFSKQLDLKSARLAAGGTVVDMSIGAPNLAPAEHVMRALADAAMDPKNYIYAIQDLNELHQAVAAWYQRRYGVTLDPAAQITSLLGSQEGLAHIALTLADEGDVVLVPDPCYPVFADGPKLAGAELHYMPMKPEKDFVIDLRDIPTEVAKRAKLMVVSYPNNPTTAMAPDAFYRDLIAFAREYGIGVLHDNAYSELVYDGAQWGSRRGRGVQFPLQDLRSGRGPGGLLRGQRRDGGTVGQAEVQYGLRHVPARPAGGHRRHYRRSELCGDHPAGL